MVLPAMVTVTDVPLFVTIFFRGMPGMWKSHHSLMLGWLVVMQALFPGRKTLEERYIWTPPLSYYTPIGVQSNWSV
jgi:hypothetical protein